MGVRDSEGGWPTKRDAQEWAANREKEIRDGKAGKFPDKTLAEALTLLSRKVDVQTLQKISGHVDINVLIRHYYRESAEQVAARI